MVSLRASLCMAACLAAALPVAGRALLDPLTARVLHEPSRFRGDDGRDHLVYELEVINVAEQPTTVSRLEVTGPGGIRHILDQRQLAASFRRFGSREEPRTLTLDSGVAGLIYLEIVSAEGAALRGPLSHRLTVETGEAAGREIRTIDLAPVAVVTAPLPQIGPPVRGGPWLVENGPSNTSGHRRLPISLDGRATLFQRYAIDYIKLDEQGRQLLGDRLDNRSYFTEGQEAIAVADAAVVAATDGIAENVPDQTPQGDALSLATVYGNSVVLALKGGQFAVYAHLLPGSVRVRAGDRVRRGQVLAKIGNTGNSIMPHLHFQLADSPATLSGEGLPYAHARFEWLGKCATEGGSCAMQTPQSIRDALPLNQSIVRFE